EGAPRYRDTIAALLRSKDVAFVFGQTYEFTDPELLALFEEVAERAPVYAIVGEAGDAVKEAWNGGKVRWVESRAQSQGRKREFRIDHNKNLIVAMKDG